MKRREFLKATGLLPLAGQALFSPSGEGAFAVLETDGGFGLADVGRFGANERTGEIIQITAVNLEKKEITVKRTLHSD